MKLCFLLHSIWLTVQSFGDEKSGDGDLFRASIGYSAFSYFRFNPFMSGGPATFSSVILFIFNQSINCTPLYIIPCDIHFMMNCWWSSDFDFEDVCIFICVLLQLSIPAINQGSMSPLFDKHPDNLPSPSRASQVHSAPSLLVLGVHVNVHAESPRPGGVKRLNKKCHCYGSDWTKSIFFPKALHLINLRRIWTIPSRPSMAATIKPVLPSESSRWQSRLFSSNNNSTC